MTYKFSETYTDRQDKSGWDIHNCTSNWHPTIRKYINRDDEVVAQHTINGIIRSAMSKMTQIPAENMTDEFCEGAHFMEVFYVSAIHKYFMETEGLEEEEIDIIFKISDDNKPCLDITLDQPYDPDEDNGDDDEDKPVSPSPVTAVEKLKEDLDL
tara:strand:- start:58 stop:522 length:465 start_codon:yes stop_codon:yes gene_type:complete